MAKIDGIDILQEGIIYTQTNWRKLALNDSTKDIQGVHGRTTSPMYARYRIITLEGLIDRLNSNEEEKIKHLQDIFSLQSYLSVLEEKDLYIKDLYDNEWSLKVKIKEPLDFVEGDDNFVGSHYKWRVVLESTKTPIYKSYNELLVNGNEGSVGGFKLGINFPFISDSLDEIIEVETLKTETYSRFEIDVTKEVNMPLTIKNLTNNTFFSLNIDAEAGDKIVIDSDKYKASKNGENIIGTRIPGSTWQKISGKNKFVVTDLDGNVFSKDFKVKIYYRNALL